jgi:BASS family bile acid:Na+ symporter
MTMKKICDFISRWMGALVLAIAVVAVAVPAPFESIGTWVINPMLGLIMFGMGMTLSPHDFQILLRRPKDVLIGTTAQFLIMPALAWLLTVLFQLPEELALGVILVGCCPGGTASNVITYLAKGDLALSVGVTATSTILAPLMTPFLVWLLAGTFVHVDTVGMLMSIVYVIILPIIAGFLIQHYLPTLTQRAVTYLPAFSTLMITGLVGIVVGHNASRLLTGGMVVLVVVVVHNLCGLLLGYGVSRLCGLSLAKRKALSIEVGMQNSGLASSLATIHFAAFPMAAIPGAIFSVWHNISGALVARMFINMKE